MISLPIKVSGTVLHGRQLGRTIDMPTVNIIPDIDLSSLPFGVYYSKVYVDDCCYKGITNVGVKPTVQDETQINVETFLYDFSGDLYGKELSVELIEFRRPEMKFDSFEALSTQMHQDLEAGKKYVC